MEDKAMSDNHQSIEGQLQQREQLPDAADRTGNLNALDLMRESNVTEVSRAAAPSTSPAAASMLGGFEIVVPVKAAASAVVEMVCAPQTDAFAQAPPAGGAETGGFNPNMFGD